MKTKKRKAFLEIFDRQCFRPWVPKWKWRRLSAYKTNIHNKTRQKFQNQTSLVTVTSWSISLLPSNVYLSRQTGINSSFRSGNVELVKVERVLDSTKKFRYKIEISQDKWKFLTNKQTYTLHKPLGVPWTNSGLLFRRFELLTSPDMASLFPLVFFKKNDQASLSNISN